MPGPVLITGASGFIGQSLVESLASAGYQVRAASRSPLVLRFPRSVEVNALPDLSKPAAWEPLLDGVAAVVHLAGLSHSRHVADGIADRINHMATAEFARAAASCKVRHFIYVSSIRAQSGPSADHVLTEADTPKPTDIYGRSKLAAEQAVRASGVPFTILRPVLVAGPGAKGNLAALAKLAASRFPLPFGSFQNLRSMVSLEDLTAAIRLVLEGGTTVGDLFLVADPTPMSVGQIIATLREAEGRAQGLIRMPPFLAERLLTLVGRRELWDRLGGTLVAAPDRLLAAGWRPNAGLRAALIAMQRAA